VLIIAQIVMASTDHLRSGVESASEVLGAVIYELRELRASYNRVARRIRVLKGAMHALHELDAQSFRDHSEQVAVEVASRGKSSEPNTILASEKAVGRLPAIQKRSIHNHQNPDLRRACRIALLETANAVSDGELLARITRRGSFCFADTNSALLAIDQQLTAMAEQGEILAINSSSQRLWQRISSVRDSQQ
jgi:hypothetical protein